MFRNWPSDRDGIGQDWKLWCGKGWLDFVCPMDYLDSNDLFRNVVETQKAYAGKVPLYPEIDEAVRQEKAIPAHLSRCARKPREK